MSNLCRDTSPYDNTTAAIESP